MINRKTTDELVGRAGLTVYTIPFPALLTTLFVGLKLSDAIGWSWWWVLSPLWIPLAMICALITGLLTLIWLSSAGLWFLSFMTRDKRRPLETVPIAEKDSQDA